MLALPWLRLASVLERNLGSLLYIILHSVKRSCQEETLTRMQYIIVFSCGLSKLNAGDTYLFICFLPSRHFGIREQIVCVHSSCVV